ncbi:DsbA family protein [Colwellia sp. TT2012]|uniref:DsbA family protein n=1 Tax=Colwellia sp. TT2012 TaxID=1720342 RepID=UPI00070C35E7|nr:DsbA family protein [Colwellia sp. TT2012]
MSTKLYYLHDPMCSWCWGYRPVWDELQKNLPASISVEYVAGGLAADSNEPMPIAQQDMIQNHWRTITKKLGTSFNHDFWRDNMPRRSTYNACRAAISAHKQACQKPMIDAIQQGYYLRALNPADLEVLIALAKVLSQQQSVNLDIAQFTHDISSAETDKELARQVNLARQLSQQGFPALVLESKGIRQQISVDYRDYRSTLADIMGKVD